MFGLNSPTNGETLATEILLSAQGRALARSMLGLVRKKFKGQGFGAHPLPTQFAIHSSGGGQFLQYRTLISNELDGYEYSVTSVLFIKSSDDDWNTWGTVSGILEANQVPLRLDPPPKKLFNVQHEFFRAEPALGDLSPEQRKKYLISLLKHQTSVEGMQTLRDSAELFTEWFSDEVSP